MKMLYIGRKVEKIQSGADAVNKRNISFLEVIYGKDFYKYFFSKEKNNFFEKLNGYFAGYSAIDEYEILKLINENRIDCVFISQSFYGRIAKVLKQKYPSIIIISFFHNIEKQFARECLQDNGLKYIPFYLLASYHEKKCVSYSDYYITLNERDSYFLKSIYSANANIELPVSYEDMFESNRVISNTEDFTLLFVGTAFFGNITGIQFFLDKVINHVNAKLIIVGKGMDQYKVEWEKNNKVSVYGYVDDLSEFYYMSSAVIAPILSGGGMKTKIAEALMFGKTVIGTKEAFQGYIQNPVFTIECNDKDEFIENINNLSKVNFNPFNLTARNTFLDLYNNKSLIFKFENFLSVNKLI